jgi:hypothetical protein
MHYLDSKAKVMLWLRRAEQQDKGLEVSCDDGGAL